MKVTNVWVKKYEVGKLLGFADVQFSLDDSDEGHMVMKGFKLFQGKEGLQVGLPSKKDEQGKTDEKTGKVLYHPVVTIPTSEDRPNEVGKQFLEHIRGAVETAYNKSGSTNSSDNSKDKVGTCDIPF